MTQNPQDVRILAVDDTEEDCRLHEMVLTEAGFQVDTAQTAREARALLEKTAYGVLLVDLQMPDGSGLDLLAPARRRDPHAVAVILTGHASMDTVVAALKAGAYDYLTKPCKAEILVSVIMRAAEKYNLSSTLNARTRELEELNDTLDRRVRDATQEIFSLNEKLKRYIADLVETNNSQTHALEEMAHELKNPLSVISGYSSFLLKSPMEDWTTAELKRSLTSIRKNAFHLQVLIDALLDSARLSSKKIMLEKKVFPALEAVEEAIESVHLQAEEAEIILTAECEDKLQVSADRIRLRQILVNLLTNALKYTPPAGTVCISALSSADDGTLFTVTDSGKGMEPEQLEHVFERFYQVRGKGIRNRGLGLGLNIVEGLVKLHKGRVWAESKPGNGSKFFVFLPAERVPATNAATN
ncbi:MAG: ATP-binding protein [Elusimicrobiota bacterium]